MNPTRSIPEPIKRRLRQEAGFGCCVCGNPIYEYHHIEAFSEHAEHAPATMMVLCPNHHYQATVGALPREEQELWKAGPFNIKHGLVEGQLTITDPLLAVVLGGNLFVGEGVKLEVDGKALLELHQEENDRVSISLEVFDEDETLLALIHRNEWIAGDPLPWDIEFGHRWLRVRRGKGEPVLLVDARKRPIEVLASLWWRRQHFGLRENYLEFDGVVNEVKISNLAWVGFVLVADTAAKSFSIKPDPTLGSGTMVSWPDTTERLEMALAAYARLKATG